MISRLSGAIRSTWLLLGFVLAPALSGCGDDEAIDEAGARMLWEEIQDADYPSWARAPGWEERLPSVSAHGQTADVFVNPVTEEALVGSDLEEWPEGSTSVKDSHRGEEHVLVAAMQKQSGGWFFAEWGTDGAAKYGGLEIGTCTGCHVAANDRAQAFELP